MKRHWKDIPESEQQEYLADATQALYHVAMHSKVTKPGEDLYTGVLDVAQGLFAANETRRLKAQMERAILALQNAIKE